MKIHFDSLIRYRVAAAILSIPFVLNVLTMDLRWVNTPLMLRRVIYWVGLAFLLVAVAIDARKVYDGRRRVKKLIEAQRAATEARSRETS